MTRLPATRPLPVWYARPVRYTKDNFGLNYPWLTGLDASYINVQYNATQVHADLDLAVALGAKVIRVWATVDALYSFDGTNFTVSSYTTNLDDLLTAADSRGLQVILVMADGNSQSQPASLAGKVQWSLFQSDAGIAKYAGLFTDYVTRFGWHKNIYAWELMNEPYGSGQNNGFSAYATSLGVTADQIHKWLNTMYRTVKGLDSRIVCFSDYEEEDQSKYQVFSDATFRAKYIDDCTDIYSMHIYRKSSSDMADFRAVTNKPKWLSEVGHINYNDPTASGHPTPGHDELYTYRNAAAVRDISMKALNSGFSLVMPWAIADNNFIIDKNNNNAIGDFGQWIKNQLTH